MNETKTPVEQLQQDDLIREYKVKKELSPEEQATIGAVEPWLPIETKLVVGSLIGGVAALIILAVIVHIFILGGLP